MVDRMQALASAAEIAPLKTLGSVARTSETVESNGVGTCTAQEAITTDKSNALRRRNVNSHSRLSDLPSVHKSRSKDHPPLIENKACGLNYS